MIKLSDYIFMFLKEKGVQHIFMLPGGGAMHLVDSLGNSGIEYICVQHEQAAACAAEAYGQHTNKPGVVLVTAGPGATNTITGVAAGWIDSTPMFIISGQAKRADLIGEKGVRQIGNQEVRIVDIVKPITKYAVQILEPNDIKYHLERAYYEACTGRMGPVWLDVPLDVQAAMVEEGELRSFTADVEQQYHWDKEIEKCIQLIEESKKPLILVGNGVKSAKAEEVLEKFLSKVNIPFCTTWKSLDMFDEEHPLYVGHPGGMGDRGANFILQESDLLIILGSRVDNSITAFNEENFAPKARKIIVDIDVNEINKFSMPFEVSINDNVKYFLEQINKKIENVSFDAHTEWISHCKKTRKKYPVILPENYAAKDRISVYYFIDILCNFLNDQDVIVPESSGGAAEITCQAFRIKKGQKMKHAAGLGSMGFGLPYAIGSCIANNKRRTVLINGDGAFQLNIQELETLSRLKLPVKIFIINNGGYASIRAMQRNNFAGHYVASDENSGISMPNISRIAEAYGIRTWQVYSNQELDQILLTVFEDNEPGLCEMFTLPNETVSPRVKTITLEDGTLISSSLDNMWPFLDDRVN